MNASLRAAALALVALVAGGCAHAPLAVPAPVSPAAQDRVPTEPAALASSTQLVLVTTASWDTTGGEMRRFERAAPGAPWSAVGAPVPVVVGRSGLAWDGNQSSSASEPVKREGDGRAPAGLFPLDTAFGFASATEAAWVRMPYVALTSGSECVDDGASVHYNTVVDRARVPAVDWTSAERMRQIDQYRLGVIVGYNVPPRAGRGSCIFLHIWGGPGSSTAGCTAMAEEDLRALVLWMDRARAPRLVQLTERAYAARRVVWGLP